MRIKQVHLETDELEETRKFYHNLFGFRILQETSGELSVQTGYSALHWHTSQGKKPVYHFAFSIPSNQIIEAMEWVGERTAIIPVGENAIADFSNWDAEAFYFSDNNGNILEFIGRRDLHIESSSPFSQNSLIGISEIGLVVPDVEAYCDELMKKYGLRYFDKQPPSKDFTAVGDDEGLFIVVSAQHNWYPTAIPSSWSRVKAVIENEGNEFAVELAG